MYQKNINKYNNNFMIFSKIRTLQILKESERIRKFSLKANPNIHLELLKKNKARRSCKDSEKMNIVFYIYF